MRKKINKIKTSDPKEYWKLLNKGRDRKQPNIPVQTKVLLSRTYVALTDFGSPVQTLWASCSQRLVSESIGSCNYIYLYAQIIKRKAINKTKPNKKDDFMRNSIKTYLTGDGNKDFKSVSEKIC